MAYGQSDPFFEVRRTVSRLGIPVTFTVVALNAVLFLVDYFSGGAVSRLVGCALIGRTITPIWGPFTYALNTPGYMQVIFGCLWMWWLGGTLERSWGSRRFGFFALGVEVVTALCVWLGTSLLHAEYLLMGLWIPLAPLTVAWAAINPRQMVTLYMVLPVPAWGLALFEIGFTYFVYFGGEPLLGLFGLLPCAVAYYYVHSGKAAGYGSGRGYRSRGPDLRMVGAKPATLDGSRARLNPLAWYRERQERKRLEKLWRDSGFSDRDRRS